MRKSNWILPVLVRSRMMASNAIGFATFKRKSLINLSPSTSA